MTGDAGAGESEGVAGAARTVARGAVQNPAPATPGAEARAGVTGHEVDVNPSPGEPVASALPAVPGYDVVRRLGAGASCEVFLAREQAGLGRPVALKVFRPASVSAAPWTVEAAYRRELDVVRKVEELRRAARCGALVQSLATGEAPGLWFLAFEWLEGGSLQDQVERAGPLPLEDALTCARDVAGALALMHGAGIFHRDVKPGNLLLGADGRVRLADFGLSRPLDGTLSAAGSPAFAAPEVIAGKPTDGRRIDVYSLGATLAWLLTGETMLPGRPDVFVLERRGVPRPLQRVVVDAMACDPQERLASAEALLARLDAIRPTTTTSSSTGACAPALARETRSREVVARPVDDLVRPVGRAMPDDAPADDGPRDRRATDDPALSRDESDERDRLRQHASDDGHRADDARRTRRAADARGTRPADDARDTRRTDDGRDARRTDDVRDARRTDDARDARRTEDARGTHARDTRRAEDVADDARDTRRAEDVADDARDTRRAEDVADDARDTRRAEDVADDARDTRRAGDARDTRRADARDTRRADDPDDRDGRRDHDGAVRDPEDSVRARMRARMRDRVEAFAARHARSRDDDPAREERRQHAWALIERAGYAAAAHRRPGATSRRGAALPVHVAMVLDLGTIHGCELDEEGALRLLQHIDGSAGSVGLFDVGTQAVETVAKLLLPGVGGVASAPTPFETTLAIGGVAIAWFERGGQLAAHEIKDLFREGLAVARRTYEPARARSIARGDRDRADEVDELGPASPGPAPARDVQHRLAQLARLRALGLISEAEHEETARRITGESGA